MPIIIYPLAIVGLLLFAYLLHIVGNRFKYLIEQQNLKSSMVLIDSPVITSDNIQKLLDKQAEIFREYVNDQAKIQQKLLADNKSFQKQIEQLKVKKTGNDLIKTILMESLVNHVRKTIINDAVVINGHITNSNSNPYYLITTKYSSFNSITNNKIELESPNYN